MGHFTELSDLELINRAWGQGAVDSPSAELAARFATAQKYRQISNPCPRGGCDLCTMNPDWHGTHWEEQ